MTQRDTDAELIAWLLEHRPDADIVALHGSRGDNGAIQSILEMIGIPYVGTVSAIAGCPTRRTMPRT